MIKKLLTVAALTLVLSSCTADKFEQIDANFALLVEENERINDAIDSNSDDITSLEEALDDAVEYLEDLVEDASEALTAVIDTLSEDTTSVLNQLADADTALGNDIEALTSDLADGLENLQNQVDTNLISINDNLAAQVALSTEQAADLLALKVALETAEGDAAANLESAIAALESEIAIEFADFSVDINTLLAGVPSQVRAEVAEALLAISFNASNVLEITVVNPTDELNALEANVIALQLQITQLLEAGSGTVVDIVSTQNDDGSIALAIGDNTYTIPAGADGADGIDGLVGGRGAQGIQGLQGTIGMNGVAGIAGSAGATGTTGTVGQNGADGQNGIPGVTGADGTTPVINVRTEVDGKVFINVNGVDYLIIDPPALATFALADWNLMTTIGNFVFIYEITPNANRYSINADIDNNIFLLTYFINEVGNPITIAGATPYTSFVQASQAAYDHSVLNP